MPTTPPTPYQWSVGDVGSAALLNAQLFAGLTYLLNPALAVLYASATQTLTTSGTSYQMNLDTAVTDPFAGLASHAWTAPFSGWFELYGKIYFTGNTTGSRAAFLNIAASSALGSEGWGNPSNGSTCSAEARTTAYVTAGQAVSLWGFQSSGGSLTTASSSSCFALLTVKHAHM